MRIGIITLLLVVLFCSCSETDFTEINYTRKLVKHTWHINSYVDNSVNELMDITDTKYEFQSNGVLIKTLYDGSQHEVNWEFYDGINYIIIGDNTFKISTLTNKLLHISYGEIDIFFVPV